MTSSIQPETPSMDRPGVKERLREELHRYATVSAYLYVCFSALLLYKYALLREAGQPTCRLDSQQRRR